MKTNPFAFLIHQVETHLPAPLRPLHTEVKAGMKKVAQEKLSRFDLVPRAQFQAQQQQIAQAQAQIAALEARLSALESAHTSASHTNQ